MWLKQEWGDLFLIVVMMSKSSQTTSVGDAFAFCLKW